MNGLDICKQHNKRLKFFCNDENKLVCTACAIVDHRNCKDVVEITNIAEDNNCKELRNELRTFISSIKEIVENLTEVEMTLSTDVQQIQEKLKKLRQMFVNMFDDFSKNVTDAAISYRNKLSSKWTSQQGECESQIADLNKTLDTIDDIVQNGTASEQFIVDRSMSDILEQQSNDALTICTDLKVLNVECNFKEHFEKFKTNLTSTLTSNEFEIKYNVPQKTKLKLMTSIYLKQTGDVDVGEPFYSGLDFLPDGRLVAVDNKNGKCLIYDGNLKLQTSYRLPCDHPLGIVSVSDEDIAITSGMRLKLHFLHVSNNNEITLDRTCEVKACCESISMKDNENCVVGCYDDNIPVRIVSTSGEEITTDLEFPSKNYPIDTTFCTYIRGLDKLVMSDREEDVIWIYDFKKREMSVVNDELIMTPYDVAVGPCDHVFVCNYGTNSIVEISPGGRVLSSHELPIECPRYLAVSKDKRKVAVSSGTAGANMIALYTITSE